jgi:hypothetical protein
MSNTEQELLNHRIVYIPQAEGIDVVKLGKAAGFYIAQQQRARLTVLTPGKQNASYHDEFKKLEVITERTGYPDDSGVILAWCPTYKAMDKIRGIERATIVLVEWITGEYDAWARLVGAYNLVDGKVMDAGLSDAGRKALEGVVYEGYNGWSKDTDVLLTTSHLRDLEAAGEYDRELVLAYARIHRGITGTNRLEKLLEKFEAKLSAGTIEP